MHAVHELQAALIALRGGATHADVSISSALLSAWKYVMRARKDMRTQKAAVQARESDDLMSVRGCFVLLLPVVRVVLSVCMCSRPPEP